ncbi:MAG: condensation domain-containing protein, partial [Myxococcota bacterium]
MSPAQKRFFAIHRRAPEHFNHAVLIERVSGFDRARLQDALTRLTAAHDVFRLRFPMRGGARAAVLDHRAPPIALADHDLRGAARPWQELARHGDDLHRSLDLGNGPLWRAGLFTLDQGQVLGLIMHHLLTDGVSWRILLTQLGAVYSALESGAAPPELALNAPFTVWTQAMQKRAESPEIAGEVDYWTRVTAGVTGTITNTAASSPSRDAASESQAKSVEVNAILGSDRLAQANRAYGSNTEELLLAALAGALHEVRGASEWVICLEGHGRDGVPCDLPIEQTVGWFTAIYPFRLQANPGRDLGYRIKHVKESLRNVPHRGQSYGLLHYGADATDAVQDVEPEISFNFLGELDSGLGEHELRLVPRSLGEDVSPHCEREFPLQFAGSVLDRSLQLGVTYSETVIDAATVDALCSAWRAHLDRVIEHCIAREAPELTPSDLTYSDLS